MIYTNLCRDRGLGRSLGPQERARREKEEYACKRSTELVPRVHVACQNQRAQVFQNGTFARAGAKERMYIKVGIASGWKKMREETNFLQDLLRG